MAGMRSHGGIWTPNERLYGNEKYNTAIAGIDIAPLAMGDVIASVLTQLWRLSDAFDDGAVYACH